MSSTAVLPGSAPPTPLPSKRNSILKMPAFCTIADSEAVEPDRTYFYHKKYRNWCSRIPLRFILFMLAPNTRGPALLKENSMMSRSHARPEKPGGPPTTSLLGSMSPGYGGGTPGRYGTPSRLDTPTLATASSQAQDLTGQDPLATWVTVFGFPPAAASFVLSQASLRKSGQPFK
jgi:hypothetical protein